MRLQSSRKSEIAGNHAPITGRDHWHQHAFAGDFSVNGEVTKTEDQNLTAGGDNHPAFWGSSGLPAPPDE